MADRMRLDGMAAEELRDMPLVELAHEVLQSSNETYYYRDLMGRIAELRRMDEAEVADAIARLYTDINVDGRFVCVGDNVWGLRRWYPTERATERGGAGKRFVRRDAVDPVDENESGLDPEDDELQDEEVPFLLDEEEEPALSEELAEEDGDLAEDEAEELEEEFTEDEEEEEY